MRHGGCLIHLTPPLPSPPVVMGARRRGPRKIMHVHIKPFGIIIDGLLARSLQTMNRVATRRSSKKRRKTATLERERERERDACVAKVRRITPLPRTLLLAYCINVSRAFSPSSIKPRCSSEALSRLKGPPASPDAVPSSIGTLVPTTYNLRLRLIQILAATPASSPSTLPELA